MKTTAAFAFLIANLAASSVHAETIRPTRVEVERDGKWTYFRAELPSAVGKASGTEGDRRHNALSTGWHPGPFLSSSPVHAAVCYPERATTTDDDRWSGDTGRPTGWFIGRTTATGELSLTLERWARDTGWSAEPVSVSLKSDKRFPDGKQTPAQRFARAEAVEFVTAGRTLDNSGGFFSYASLQTLRAAKLPLPANWSPGGGGSFDRDGFIRRAQPDDMYDLAAGTVAIGETLQLDRLLRTDGSTEPRTIDISELPAIEVAPLPYAEMRKGREPVYSKLAGTVPADQWYARFASVGKMMEAAEFAGGLAPGSTGGAREPAAANATGLVARYVHQLALPDPNLAAVFGPSLVKEFAVTGSDPFFVEGTDVTVVFRAVSAAGLKAALAPAWAAAEAAGASRPGGKKIGAETVETLLSGDGRVRAYRYFSGDLAYYSNSLPALERCVALAMLGDEPAGSLAAADDFRYARAAWPLDEAKEDGFAYLSDPFLRRVAGPEVRIKAKRRRQAAATLRLTANAALLDGWRRGTGRAPGLASLYMDGLLSTADLETPDLNGVKWDPATGYASSGRYGTLAFLTPLAELPIDKVSAGERDGYKTFHDRYASYWRDYFDPIAIRCKVGGKSVAFDVSVAPLIEGSAYNRLKEVSGTKPGTFDLSAVSTSTLARWQVRLDPKSKLVTDARNFLSSGAGRDNKFFDWLGEWFAVMVEDGARIEEGSRGWLDTGLPDMFGGKSSNDDVPDPAKDDAALYSGRAAKSYRLPVGISVQVGNPIALATFLVGVQGLVGTAAPGMVRFDREQPYGGVAFVRISPGEEGRQSMRQMLAESDRASTSTEPAAWYGIVGDSFILTLDRSVLEGAVDARKARQAADSAGGPGKIEYAAFMLLSPGNARKSGAAARRGLAYLDRTLERESLYDAWLLARCGLAGPGTSDAERSRLAMAYLDRPWALPSGGTLSFDAKTGEPVSSAFGPMRHLKWPVAGVDPPSGPARRVFDGIAHVRAWCRFTAEGLESRIEIDRR